jgi:hypothetical protein
MRCMVLWPQAGWTQNRAALLYLFTAGAFTGAYAMAQGCQDTLAGSRAASGTPAGSPKQDAEDWRHASALRPCLRCGPCGPLLSLARKAPGPGEASPPSPAAFYTSITGKGATPVYPQRRIFVRKPRPEFSKRPNAGFIRKSGLIPSNQRFIEPPVRACRGSNNVKSCRQ